MAISSGKTQLHILLPRKTAYRPGEWIEGVVLLDSYGEISGRAIRLKSHAFEKTQWKTGSGKNTHHYGEKVELWTSHITLWGYPKNSNAHSKALPTGSSAFPFCVQLPDVELAASYKFEHGKAVYFLTAYIDVPLAIDIETTIEIPVLPRAPWNPKAIEPNVAVEEELHHKVGCLAFDCCACCGTVDMRARCLQPVVAPNRAVPSTVQVNSASSCEISELEVSLIHAVTVRDGKYSATFRFPVTSQKFPIVVRSGGKFSNIAYAMPSGDGAESETLVNTAKPFELALPAALPETFNGRNITSQLLMQYHICFSNYAATDGYLEVEVAAAPSADQCAAEAHKETGEEVRRQAREAIQFAEVSTGIFPVFYSFDGMDYRSDDQVDKSKAVSYPCFHDASHGVIPASLDFYRANWRQMLFPATMAK